MPTPQEALRARLEELEAQLDGQLAFVFDGWGLVWRTSRYALSPPAQKVLLGTCDPMEHGPSTSPGRGSSQCT